MNFIEKNSESKMAVPDIGVYSRPYFGERMNGDWAFVAQSNDMLYIAIVDGTGHGLKANKVSSIAKEIIKEQWSKNLNHTIKRLHEKLSTTLGAAIALSTLNLKTYALEYIGVGNTVFRKIGHNSVRFVSVEGVVGVRMRNPNLQKVFIEDGDILLFYTDGIKEGFDIDEIPNIARHSASLTAKNVVQTFGSQFDDSTCIVIKIDYAN